MKLLIFYSAWTFICSFFMKSALTMLFDYNVGYWPAIMITIFVQIAIVVPIVSVISTATQK